MKKQKISVTVVRTDQYEIEIDKDAWTPGTIKDWSKEFSEASEVADVAAHLARELSHKGIQTAEIEGFGYVRRSDATFTDQPIDIVIAHNGLPVPDEKYNPSIAVKIQGHAQYEVDAYYLRTCRGCGCTDDDCSQCIERTGEPCSWVAKDLCSACKS